MIEYVVLGVAAFSAGLVDAVVGGGGLIQLPAMFSIFPNMAPATIIGTNKLAAWSVAAPAAFAALIFSFFGAYTVTKVSPDFFRTALPVVLLAVAIYTFAKKDFGSVHAPLHTGRKEQTLALLIGSGIGFYDGFFGPGTGSFLVFLFVRIFGFDFLGASAVSKVVNVACNFSALVWFGYSGHLIWQLGAMMAVCQIGGSVIGSRLAMKHGSGFVRKLFLVVVSILIVKTGYDAWIRW
jgi:uncharacterized membrane protein YfcA